MYIIRADEILVKYTQKKNQNFVVCDEAGVVKQASEIKPNTFTVPIKVSDYTIHINIENKQAHIGVYRHLQNHFDDTVKLLNGKEIMIGDLIAYHQHGWHGEEIELCKSGILQDAITTALRGVKK